MNYNFDGLIMILFFITNALAFGILDAYERCSRFTHSLVFTVHILFIILVISLFFSPENSPLTAILVFAALLESTLIVYLPAAIKTKTKFVAVQWLMFGAYKGLTWFLN